jgi:uncharacterized protein YbbK (DUF523 family)
MERSWISMDKLLISACLLGEPCRYDGIGKRIAELDALSARYELLPFCPEVAAGLSTPRSPSERVGACVVTKDGADVTQAYRTGAELALSLCRREGCVAAVLKERSPSCGSGEIYDGTFTHTVISGDGVTAELLKRNGIPVYGESQLAELLR